MTDVYPVLPGLGFSVFKEPQFNTRVQKSITGRELRVTYAPVPRWLFKLKYEVLRDKNDTRQGSWGTQLDELRTLMGFFLKQQGQLTPFLFDDPTDDTVVGLGSVPTGVMSGAGDGVTTQFQLMRAMPGGIGNFGEPIIAPNTVTHAYVNGVDPGGWAVNVGNGIITFLPAPASGTVLTWSGTFYFLVRFADDTESFENFLYQLWSIAEVKLQSVLL